MQAADALKYARSRHGSSAGDISRNKRQQEVLIAVKNKIVSLNFIADIPGFFNQVKDYITTDIDQGIVKFLAPSIQNAVSFKIKNINPGLENVLVSDNIGGASVVRPKAGVNDYSQMKKFIQENL